jgi:hypothetical protein
MKRLNKSIAGLLLIVLGPFAAIFAANGVNATGTTRSIARAGEYWEENWPLARGKLILLRFNDLLYRLQILHPVTMRVQGIVLQLDSRDLVTRTLLLSGIWEPETTQEVNTLQKGGVFLDVGAHVGYYSLLASKLVGDSGRIVSVEPNPPTIETLLRNIQLNGAGNVIVERVACTDKPMDSLPFFQTGRIRENRRYRLRTPDTVRKLRSAVYHWI